MELDRITSLCTQHQYPDAIKDYLYQCCNEFMVVEPSSVVLIGSAARGELSWFNGINRQELLSDLEFALFTEVRLRSDQKTWLQNRLTDLSTRIPYTNPHFHIDWVVIPRSHASQIARTLATFEMRALGRTLIGDEMDLHQLPQVDVHNLDMRTLNQLVLIRLWWMLAGIPQNMVIGRPTEFEKLIFQYVACRNLLDIPTILLPNEGYLIAGYAARRDFLLKNRERLPSIAYMGQQFPEDVAEALHEKKGFRFETSEFQLYAKTSDLYVRLVRYLLQVQPDMPVIDLCKTLTSQVSLFDSPIASRQRIRRLVKGGRYWLRDFSLGNLRYLVHPVEGVLIAVALSMHCALLELLQGSDTNAEHWLSTATKFLQNITLTNLCLVGSTAEKWLVLRHKVAQTLYESYSTLDRRRPFIEGLLAWTDDTGISYD